MSLKKKLIQKLNTIQYLNTKIQDIIYFNFSNSNERKRTKNMQRTCENHQEGEYGQEGLL